MSDPAAPPALEPAPFVEAWSASLGQVLGQVSGKPEPCAVVSETPPELPLPADGDLWLLSPLSGGLHGEMSLRLPVATATRFAQTFMGETPAPAAEVSPEHREAVLELLRQVAGLVASSLKPRWGEVQLRLDFAPGPPSWPASSTCWLRVGEDPATAALVEVHVSAALVAELRAEKAAAATVATPASAPAMAPAASAPEPAPTPGGGHLDLLMDVELALTLRFGSRQLSLGDILDLSPGVVIDLDRQVAEPVDVLLDGRIVARGEVVVMEGNYGLRVTEVGPGGA